MASGYPVDGWGRSSDRVPGARRQKVLGYIKAANELRQAYQSQLSSQVRSGEDGAVPGGFPDMDVVHGEDEEMLLFPSYAHKHIRKHHRDHSSANDMPGSRENIEGPVNTGDADYWRKEWEKYEDDNAIVDVDVRGWIYSPQRGPMSRRNRLLVAVARRLSGIPAPDQSPGPSRDTSTAPSFRARTADSLASHEDEAAAREAANIAQHGQREADAVWRGTYSTQSNRGDSPANSLPNSRSSSPSRRSIRTDLSEDDPRLAGLSSRQSWNSTAEMDREELLRANEQLMTRLRPFMTLPVVNSPITVFFFNDEKSVSKSVYTNESGHFNLRAALNFVPDKVRVLASENLSAVEDVIITDSEGISLVSDIDDTIKHSAIASGAREIFKNTFIRDLRELTIQGVKEWYTKLADMGVKMHYVSNSPWQLYPLLKSYFKLAGLPSGSIHLKAYSGMLQGIFEPAAERKKGSLEKIFHDFPERKFVLVGDSGEADLEVYTDIVLANPGRVLGVFIRDVHSPEKKGYFDSASTTAASSANSSRKNSDQTRPDQNDTPERRPSLPSRPKMPPEREESLIDFGEDATPSEQARGKSTYEDDMRQLQQNNGRPPAPNKPNKPSNLRSISTAAAQSNKSDQWAENVSQETKRAPPPPPKPRRPSSGVSPPSQQQVERPPFSSSRQDQSATQRPGMDSRASSTYSVRGEEEGYAASARRHLNTAYNALPTIRSQSPTREGLSSRAPPPPPSPRRGLSSYPAAAARWATGATGGDPAAGGDGGAPGAPYNKKEEFWKRRWARSEEIMRSDGVVLKTWRVGSDVMDECVRLVERAMRDGQNQGGKYRQ